MAIVALEIVYWVRARNCIATVVHKDSVVESFFARAIVRLSVTTDSLIDVGLEHSPLVLNRTYTTWSYLKVDNGNDWHLPICYEVEVVIYFCATDIPVTKEGIWGDHVWRECLTERIGRPEQQREQVWCENHRYCKDASLRARYTVLFFYCCHTRTHTHIYTYRKEKYKMTTSIVVCLFVC